MDAETITPSSGEYAPPISALEMTSKGPLVLLFYDGYERRALPGMLGALQSQSRRFVRYAKRTLCHQQVRSGLYTAFLGLVKSLEHIGCDVRINAFHEAQKRPHYPIGLAGFPTVLDKVTLPNPKIFGPGDYGLPNACSRVINDPTFVTLIQPSKWACDIFRPGCDAKIWPWFAGIDTDEWPDLSQKPKQYDFIVYDKIRWHRDVRVSSILNRITAHLESKNHTYIVLRYGQHHHSQFATALDQSRAMLFICEHETQGIACQEALSSNIPVLAWDEGKIVDPIVASMAEPSITVSSVPYFDGRCGLTFTMDNFESQFANFCARLSTFTPRNYVQENLSLTIAGKRYLNEYQRIAEGCIHPRDERLS